MSTEQHESLRMAEGLEQRRVTNWVNSTGETPRAIGLLPDRECNNAAAMLRASHALIVQMAEALKHARQVLNHHNLPLECNLINVAIASANTYLKGPKT